jgi:hypothetical protein
MSQYVEQYRNDPEFQQKADEIMAQVLTRSATDADFRRKLVENPAQALAEFTGTDASHFAHLNIAFVESSAAATVVLPDVVEAAELTEGELESVAGGSEPVTVSVAAAIGIATLGAACITAIAVGVSLAMAD